MFIKDEATGALMTVLQIEEDPTAVGLKPGHVRLRVSYWHDGAAAQTVIEAPHYWEDAGRLMSWTPPPAGAVLGSV